MAYFTGKGWWTQSIAPFYLMYPILKATVDNCNGKALTFSDLARAYSSFASDHWRTKEGKTLLIKDLPDKHLMNIINLFIKKGTPEVTWRRYKLLLEAEERGLWDTAKRLKARLTGLPERMWKLD